jgi:two-component system, LytTR family, sensor kinase
MQKQLIQYAIMSAPILALFALSPLLIFGIMTLSEIPALLGGMLINIMIVWTINILIFTRIHRLGGVKRIMFSYLMEIVFQGCFFLINFFTDFRPPIAAQYIFYPILISLSFNAIILLLCSSVEQVFKAKRAEAENQELRFQNVEAQKQLLLRQLNPHFLFNSLSVLKSLIHEKPDAGIDYSVKLSDFLRYSLKAASQSTVILRQELDFTLNYIELQKVRFGTSFTLTTQLPDEIMTYKISVYAMQTLVENAFKHNYFTRKNPLQIFIEYQNNWLTIRNNKTSIKLTERSGLGLKNLNLRHQLITGREITILEDDLSFSVTLMLMKP